MTLLGLKRNIFRSDIPKKLDIGKKIMLVSWEIRTSFGGVTAIQMFSISEQCSFYCSQIIISVFKSID